MEQTRNANLPIIGMVQHGIQIQNPNGTKRAKELGYFIAKVQDKYMQKFLQKFDEIYKGKKYIEIEFVNDNPLTKKFVRYNQSGEVCYCLEGNNTGSQKTKNGWKPIECNTVECPYRQRNEAGKTACNRIGWLKFFIPKISKDRIWLMKITGQKSIDRLDSYIKIQKAQGNPLNNRYILFLKQEEQENKFTGQKFNNYVLDILKKEDFLLEQTIPQTSEMSVKQSTANEQNVNNNVVNQELEVIENNNISNVTPIENIKPKESSTKKSTATTKKQTKSKSKKEENAPKETKSEDTKTENTEDKFKNCYALLRTFTEKLTNKKGKTKEYLIGEFADMQDNISNIVIRPEDSEELTECDLGTFVKIEVNEIGGKKFAMKLEFIEKRLKNIAA